MTRPRIGLLGGSFDPIHVGHLALGRAAIEALGLTELRLIPTGHSWQKGDGRTAPAHRLAMTRIAVADRPGAGDAAVPWVVDDIEVRRPGPTYTVETLAALRASLGDAASLVLLLGSDQLRNLASWHRWTELTELAHIATTQREQVPLADLPPAVDALVAARGRDALPDAPAGALVMFRMPAVAVSATGLRNQLARGEDPGELLPAGVFDYIRTNHLYGIG